MLPLLLGRCAADVAALCMGSASGITGSIDDPRYLAVRAEMWLLSDRMLVLGM
jgi:hypothetical protein